MTYILYIILIFLLKESLIKLNLFFKKKYKQKEETIIIFNRPKKKKIKSKIYAETINYEEIKE
ncbi:MAG: hypothetical protein NHF86_00925 [Candidatus Bostrichicola ureolyticus]|nr:MAG: hypothetical protein NHF86_00925 [Candidatus Bostrichicola ureolyticus]